MQAKDALYFNPNFHSGMLLLTWGRIALVLRVLGFCIHVSVLVSRHWYAEALKKNLDTFSNVVKKRATISE